MNYEININWITNLLLCHLVRTFCFSLFCYDILFMCGRLKRAKHNRSDKDNKSDYGSQLVVNLESYVF